MQLKTVFVAASLLLTSAQGLANSEDVCKNVTLTVDKVVFDSSCGKSPEWTYVDKPQASYFEFLLDNGFVAKKHLDKYPGEEYTACLITIVARYPKGCTFSPSYVGFFGHANIAPGHSGRVGLTLIDVNDTENQLEFGTKEFVNSSKNFAIKKDLTKNGGKGFWAPCKGKAWLHYSLFARIKDQDESRPGQFLSSITVDEGTGVYRNTAKLGFKECDPE